MKGYSRMRQDKLKNKKICCILSKEDLEQTGSFLEVLQTNAYQYEIVFQDLTDRDQQCIRESDRVVFFASQKSVQSESLFHTLRLAADNQKDILTVYLENCTLSSGMHMLLDPYQAIMPSGNVEDMISAYRESLANMDNVRKVKKRSNRFARLSVIIPAAVIIGLLSVVLVRQFFFNNSATNQPISEKDYAAWLDTTKDPKTFAEAFFDMVRIGEDGTYQNLWDRFVAQAVKNSGCITEEQWLDHWQKLKEQNYTIIDRRVVSAEENSDQSSYRVLVDLRFQLNDVEERQTIEIAVIEENGVCKYLDGEPVSTGYISSESSSEELAI